VPYGLFLGPEELSAAKATRRADPGVTEAA
jgi:hypothetical protein